MKKSNGLALRIVLYGVASVFLLLTACRPYSPPPPPAPLPPAQPEYRLEQVKADALNVRSGPDNKSEVLTVLYKGTTVEIVGRDGNWIQILTPRKQYGWVYGAYLTGFDDISQRSSKRVLSNTRPAVPQGVENSGDDWNVQPAAQPPVESGGVSAGSLDQDDDFQSGFEGAAE